MTDIMPPPIDPSLCGPGTVPGWLNEDGLPTSCITDLPMVEPNPAITSPGFLDEDGNGEPDDAVQPSPEPSPTGEIHHPVQYFPEDFQLPTDTSTGEVATWDQDELAHTGPVEDVLLGFFIGFALVGIGILVYANHIKRSWRKGDKR